MQCTKMVARLCHCLVCKPVLWCKQLIMSCFCNQACRRFLLKVMAVYSLTFFLVLPFFFRSLPLTKYYKLFHDPLKTLDEARRMNQEQADLAESQLFQMSKSETKMLYEKSRENAKLNLVIGIITMSRYEGSGVRQKHPRYLTQVMLALHLALQQSGGLQDTTMFICNTNRVPKDHKEAINLSEFFLSVNKPTKLEINRYEREKLDYQFCLSEASKFDARYVLLLQDDALPHRDFYSVLMYILRNRLESHISHGDQHVSSNDWLWLKLNFPNSLARYERNYYFAIEWVSISLVITGVGMLLLSIYREGRGHLTNTTLNGGSQSLLNHSSYYDVFLASFVYVLLVVWLLGKPYISLARTASPSLYTLGPGTSCCLPAVLFPQSQVPGILEYLQATKLSSDNPLDFALDDYHQKRKLRQYLLSPNIFTHIGFISTLHMVPSTKEAENYVFAMKILKCGLMQSSDASDKML
ncbi:post-GPI attachment to proteins factor 4-like [Diadema antillarum]|uniref:post-GPI attachment to proteins factor 4-like n=1 Tax=Diadema antillarum TaxID=105358 RepID=UPI003A844E74